MIMRLLDKNCIDIWIVNAVESVPILNSDGYATGEEEVVYGSPVKLRVSDYPASGKVIDATFGSFAELDRVVLAENGALGVGSLVFTKEPVTPYSDNYDYTVSKILPSMNHTLCGLKVRI